MSTLPFWSFAVCARLLKIVTFSELVWLRDPRQTFRKITRGRNARSHLFIKSPRTDLLPMRQRDWPGSALLEIRLVGGGLELLDGFADVAGFVLAQFLREIAWDACVEFFGELFKGGDGALGVHPVTE